MTKGKPNPGCGKLTLDTDPTTRAYSATCSCGWRHLYHRSDWARESWEQHAYPKGQRPERDNTEREEQEWKSSHEA